MSIVERINEAASRLSARLTAPDEIGALDSLDDEALLAVIADATEARKVADVLISAGSAIVARRSVRELGQAGLAQRKGHRTPTSLVQHITGQSKADVFRGLRTGEDLTDAAARRVPIAPILDAQPWHAPITEALSAGTLTHAQFDAVRVGLGDPPVDRYPELDPDFLRAAWRKAAVILIAEAAEITIEDLRAAARIARDRLDPIGVTLRFDERYQARSLRTWIDETGMQNARIRLDDEGGAWVQAILSAALRPRRGPRFVPAAGEVDAAEGDAVTEDDRTKEQLQYDALLAALRTGAGADPQQAFGDRQPGVRIVTTAEDGHPRPGYLEDSGASLPWAVIEKYLCDAGTLDVTVDSFGNPLDLGRESRLFSARQRAVLRIRDGGCLWPGCPEPPSHCEAHHSEHWVEHRGRTDLRLGLLMCTFHHLRLHNQGWKVTRVGEEFWLYPPPGIEGVAPTLLTTKAPRRLEVA